MAWLPLATHVPAGVGAARPVDVAGVVIGWTATPTCSPRAERARVEALTLARRMPHLVVGRDGTVYQLVDLEHVAPGFDAEASWPAAVGPGVRPVAEWVIAIDLANAGPLTRRPPIIVRGPHLILEVPSRWLNQHGQIHRGDATRVGARAFEPYTHAQRAALRRLAEQLACIYPTLRSPAAWAGRSELNSGRAGPGGPGPLAPWGSIPSARPRSRVTAS